MGKLRDGLIAADKIAKAIEKDVKSAADDFEGTVNDAWQLMNTGLAGIDELYVYIETKLKKAGKKYKDEEGSSINDFADGTVTKFLKGVVDLKKDACEVSSKWGNQGKGLSGDLDKLQGALADISKQLDKKKKKLLQSKKYKAKLGIYEKALDELGEKAKSTAAALKTALESEPPSTSMIQKNLAIDGKSTLKQLDNATSMGVKELLKKYTDTKNKVTGAARKFRECGDFRGELKTIGEMVKEADEMEEEAEEK